MGESFLPAYITILIFVLLGLFGSKGLRAKIRSFACTRWLALSSPFSDNTIDSDKRHAHDIFIFFNEHLSSEFRMVNNEFDIFYSIYIFFWAKLCSVIVSRDSELSSYKYFERICKQDAKKQKAKDPDKTSFLFVVFAYEMMNEEISKNETPKVLSSFPFNVRWYIGESDAPPCGIVYYKMYLALVSIMGAINPEISSKSWNANYIKDCLIFYKNTDDVLPDGISMQERQRWMQEREERLKRMGIHNNERT